MISAKASYWMAVGLLAFIVSNHFAGRYENEVRQFAGRSLAAVQQISGDATRFIASAEMVLSGDDARFVRAQSAVNCAQTRLASLRTKLATRQAALAKAQAEREQLLNLQQLRSTIICPRQNLRIAIPQLHRDGNI